MYTKAKINEFFIAKIGAETAENEPSKVDVDSPGPFADYWVQLPARPKKATKACSVLRGESASPSRISEIEEKPLRKAFKKSLGSTPARMGFFTDLSGF